MQEGGGVGTCEILGAFVSIVLFIRILTRLDAKWEDILQNSPSSPPFLSIHL
jgi:hypothetical protein